MPLMPKVHDSRIIPLSRKQAFAVMMDIEKYPAFIPFIRAVRILKDEPPVTEAEIRVGLPGIAFTYRCRITADAPASIHIHDIAGPFRYLKCTILFEDAGPGKTRIDYSFESKFRSSLMNAATDHLFSALLKTTLPEVIKYIKRREL